MHSPLSLPKGRCDTCDANRVDYVKEKMPELEHRIDEIVAKGDLIELGDADINGYLYILTVTTQHGVKAARGSKSKSAKELKDVVALCVQDIQSLYPAGMCVTVSFHSDIESGFKAQTKKELQGAGIKMSTTEGHDS